MRKLFNWLKTAWTEHKVMLVMILVFTGLNTFLIMVWPRLIKLVIDNISQTPNYGKIKYYALLLFLVGIASSLVYQTLQSLRAWMNAVFDMKLRGMGFDAILNADYKLKHKFRTGDIVTRLTDDSERLSFFSCSVIFRLLEALSIFVFGFASMMQIHRLLTIFIMLPIFLIFVVFLKTEHLFDKGYKILQKFISKVNEFLEVSFSGIRVIKAFVRERTQTHAFRQIMETRKTKEMYIVHLQALVGMLYNNIIQLGIIVLILAGGFMVIKNNLTIGEFIAFNSYLMIMIWPMFDISNFVVRLKGSQVYLGRIDEIISFPQDGVKYGEKTFTKLKHGISYENVNFSFNKGDNFRLTNISFFVKKGEKLAIVGKVGAGKSVLLQLLMNYYSANSGQIKIDGTELEQLNLDSWRQQIGYVPQDGMLFSTTIKNNVSFYREQLTDEDVNWAIEVSQFAKELPDISGQLDTMLEERGKNLSGGQKQRLALARALVSKPQILLLDDCTSNLDTETEDMLWDAINRELPDATCLIVSHRIRSICNADNIIVIDNGTIVEQGTHQELLAKDGLYSALYSVE